MEKVSADNEIRTVNRVSKDGEYTVRCPHCSRLIGIEGENLSDIRGSQYRHRLCGGWLEVSHGAVFVENL